MVTSKNVSIANTTSTKFDKVTSRCSLMESIHPRKLCFYIISISSAISIYLHIINLRSLRIPSTIYHECNFDITYNESDKVQYYFLGIINDYHCEFYFLYFLH